MTCTEWLSLRIMPGRFVDNEIVRREARAAGYSREALKVARQELGVRSFNEYDKSTKTSQLFWYRKEET